MMEEPMEIDGLPVDSRIWTLCRVLNKLEGVFTMDSCGGHELFGNEGLCPSQEEWPAWRVSFGIEGNGNRCWRTLQNIIAAVSCVPQTSVESWCDGMDPKGLSFMVKGYGDPAVVGEMIQIYSEAADRLHF
jgi:hypothetical protein